MYSLQEVRKHSTVDDLWVVRKNKVYDVSDFTLKHPGGLKTLLTHAGQDVTKVMYDRDSHRHTNVAYSMMDSYHIGELAEDIDGEETTARKRNKVSSPEDEEDDEYAQELKYHGWEKDELIDWSQPLVWQVGKLGKHYMEWVHSPVDKKIRFFGTELVERLCISPWWLVPLVWVPVMMAFLYVSHGNLSAANEVWMPWLNGGVTITVKHMPALFTLGALSWTFMEYCVHRYFFHLHPPTSSRILITLHFLIHGQHHKSPMDRNRLVFPPVPASFFAFIFWYLYMSAFPHAMAQALLAGLALGYIIYDLMHYYLHHGGTPKLDYFRDLKRYHIKHHFSHQQLGFGISTKFWDYPFGTVIPDDVD